ncbi:MAG: sigma-70 family RNA polymerase sigma factor [Acidobacteriota bacterium]|nr:sigma-70 family RNA polymerase sigma factor [Acidobacteriota bacterium]MDE3163520.1 sigma-70 family RNA polymerase sigma factor [Acidobacteriota bacterium]
MAPHWQPDFEQLVDEHQSMVFSLALRITADHGLAEEVAQDVFLEMDRHLRQLDSPDHALFWLRRVAVSRATDALRRRRVRRINDWVELGDHHPVTREVHSSPLGTRIEQLLATLPAPQRAALLLRYQEDMSPEEIAAALEAPLATVKSHLQRGLKLLRAKASHHLREYIREA